MEKFEVEKYPDEIAENLYNAITDMDWMDYEEEKERVIKELTEALYYLKACAKNEYNADYFRTLYRILENI